jgi:DNA processing protein
MGSSEYPREWLGEIAYPPVALYVEGRAELLRAPSIAIVGSRNATAQGVRDAEALAHSLSDAGVTIVSGLALGIDSAAHRGGLRARGSSVAVMGTGADRIYPARNRSLADALARDGALVSEFPLGTPPLPGNFPQRNRLISGLSRGVLVVEAALRSGSLITAHCAAEQNRDVFALPGSIHSPLAKGCHSLLKEGAKLVECAEDILDELDIAHEAPVGENLSERGHRDPFLEAMGASPLSLDEIAERTGESASATAARLSLLELEGRIATIAGGFFQRLQKPRVIE